ncbi:oxidoreductase [Ascochyta rabiei]|uniref:Oxidoreductase n=1 Tax=Didymella rabiei TaxID=5454 RepID=A0A163CKV2_DIDRA|nr:oxidoreductase [Ascochyta rabiei]
MHTPALALPYPSLKDSRPTAGKVVVVNGGSSSVGSVTTQLAAAAGIHVITVVDHKHPFLVENVVEAIRRSEQESAGIADAISISDTIATDLEIFGHLGGGHFALTHPHMGKEVVPDSIEIGMIWSGGVNEITGPVWRACIGAALEFGKLKYLPPPSVVGKGLEHIQEVLKLSKAGVSGTGLVVEL